jgi:nitrate reductase assembly molybdenum cofactor insertion protein NarJ
VRTRTWPCARQLSPELAAWHGARLLLTRPDDKLEERLELVRKMIPGLPDRLAEPLSRGAAALASVDRQQLAERYDERLAPLCGVLEIATTIDPVVGGLALLEDRDEIEELRRAHEDSGSPWAGGLDAVCATLNAWPDEARSHGHAGNRVPQPPAHAEPDRIP